MSSAGAQANRFYEEVSEKRALWFAENAQGTALEFDINEGKASFPLWSSKSRINRLKKLNPELLGSFFPREITWESFKEVLVPMWNLTRFCTHRFVSNAFYSQIHVAQYIQWMNESVHSCSSAYIH